MIDVNLGIAFVAGLISFIAPCVLPIIPGFLAYIAGVSPGEAGAKRTTVFLHSIFFVLGFSTVFALIGVLLNTALSNVATEVQIWLSRVGGAIIIIFGLYLLGLVKIPWLEKNHTMQVKGNRGKFITSFLFGLAFAAGWTPCVGAVLGAILGLAATAPGSAFALLLSYALGLGIPFLVIGFFASQAGDFINRYTKVFDYISKAFGAILIILGVLVFTGELSRIASFELLNRLLLK